MASDSSLRPLPKLQLEDSDVVIKLGKEPEDWLLADVVTHPKTGKKIEFYTIALSSLADEETFLLEGKLPNIPSDEKVPAQHFTLSSLATDGWSDVGNIVERGFSYSWNPSRYAASTIAGQAALVYKALFLILYGQPVPVESLCRLGTDTDGRGRKVYEEELTDNIALIAAYAEYYGCLERVAQPLVDIFFDQAGLWEDVSKSPFRYMHLAVKLWHTKLYFDALRHIIAAHEPDQRHDLERLDLTEEEFEAKYRDGLKHLETKTRQLEQNLQKLSLIEADIPHPYHRATIVTTFLNMLSFKPKDRPNSAKAMERYDYVARTTYGQYITQQLVGQYGYHGHANNHGRWKYARGLHELCRKLEVAAKEDDPSKIFGFKAAGRMSSIFRLGAEGEKHVHRLLCDLVKQAAETIEKTFETEVRFYPEITYRRCEFEAVKGGHFTFLPLDENDVPWKDEGEWEEKKESLEVRMESASEEWLRAVVAAVGTETVDSKAKADAEAKMVDCGWGDWVPARLRTEG